MGEDERDARSEAGEQAGVREAGERNEDTERDGFSEGLEQSTGDPRVVLLLNAVLSAVFASVVTWGLSILGVLEFSLVNLATLAVLLFAVTYVVTKPDSPA